MCQHLMSLFSDCMYECIICLIRAYEFNSHISGFLQGIEALYDTYGYIYLCLSHIIPKFGIVSMNIVIIVKLKIALRKHLLRANSDYSKRDLQPENGISRLSQVCWKY